MSSGTNKTFQGYGGLEDPGGHDRSYEAIKTIYEQWAQTYDQDTKAHGYVAVDVFVKELITLFQENGTKKDVSIMDLGAGTGLVAERLREHGYENIHGLDISPEMLQIAKEKKVYTKLFYESLGDSLSMEDGTYDVITAVGTFSLGLVKPDALDEVVRITKPGGLIAFTVRGDAYNNTSLGYSQKVEEMANSQIWTILQNSVIDYDLQYTNPEAQQGRVIFCRKNNA